MQPGTAVPAAARSRVTRQLLLLRHGRTAYNATGRFQGQVDVPLDDLGFAQAARVAPLLARTGPVAIVSSDSSRAVETARPIADLLGQDVLLEESLREIDIGGWSGLTLDEVKTTFPQEYADWINGIREELRRGGGETYGEVGARAFMAVWPLLDGPPDEIVLAVTHGGTARSLIDLMLGIPVRSRHVLGGLPNAAWSRLEEGRFGWRLAEHGGHRRPGLRGPEPAAASTRRSPSSDRPMRPPPVTAWPGLVSTQERSRAVWWDADRGCGAAGSALPWHGRGQGFESPQLHRGG